MMNSFWWGSGNGPNKGIRWLSWENMSMSKCMGGMSFRDMYGFNLALLGKHCWNFLVNPDSLVARIFKARYFPNSTFLSAKRGGGSSFIWSGIWQAKEALSKGYRWIVGDHQSIDVYKDSWLRGKADFRVEANDVSGEVSAKVKDLFIPGTRMWDNVKVNSLFSTCDAKNILAMHVPQTQEVDRLAWMHTVDGAYSVETGYQFWLNSMGNVLKEDLAGANSGIWKSPRKSKSFYGVLVEIISQSGI